MSAPVMLPFWMSAPVIKPLAALAPPARPTPSAATATTIDALGLPMPRNFFFTTCS